MFRLTRQNAQLLFFFIFDLVLACAAPVEATDFFLRPTSLTMVDDWTPSLSFFVSNPTDRTIVLKVETHAKEDAASTMSAETLALKATPTEVVLKPGSRRVISLNYRSNQKQEMGDYQIVVEQLPIIYLKPHETNLPKTMIVTRYEADIKIRQHGNSEAYALNGLGQRLEGTTAMPSNGNNKVAVGD